MSTHDDRRATVRALTHEAGKLGAAPDSEIPAVLDRIQEALDAARRAWARTDLDPETRARVHVNDNALVDELTRRYSTREDTAALVARIGFPRGRVPWSGQALVFWSQVVHALRAGVIRNGVPRLIDEAFGPPVQREDLAGRVAAALAHVFHEPGQARTLLSRAGFPQSHVPAFTTAAGFWTAVVNDAVAGRASLAEIVTLAARDFPGNEPLATLRRLLG